MYTRTQDWPAMRPSAADWAALEGVITGEVILPGSPVYDLARKPAIARFHAIRPQAVVLCRDPADVTQTIAMARRFRLPAVARSGGHCFAGRSSTWGIVIDVTRMRSVSVSGGVATVGAGARLGEVYDRLAERGLTIPAGCGPSVGIAGLTLGGGLGILGRRYGLACDRLLGAQIVLADGRVIKCDAARDRELFWALRGAGGGNFGVVTSLTLQLHPVDTVIGGPILYPIEKCREALQLFRETMASTPETFNAFFAFLIAPDVPAFPEALRNQRVCGIVVCYTGPQEQAEGMLKPLRDFGPVLDAIGPLPLPMLNSMFDFTMPVGKLHHYWKADYINELSDAAIDVHAQFGPQAPYGSSAMHIYSTGGAAQRVKPDETAYSYRDANFVHIILAAGEDPADTPRGRQWVRDYWEALHPLSAGGAYVNFLMDEGDERIRATYRENYDRLVAVKRQYDPTNLFNQNQNIRP
jgi:hypothetical protein